MKVNSIRSSTWYPMLAAVVALGALLGPVITGGQVVHAGLAGSQLETTVSSEAEKRAGPITKAIVAKWWQWYLEIPGDTHPASNQKYCDQGQSGKLWYLVSGDFNRECTVPAGMDIVIPIINAECSTLEKDPFFGEDEKALRACVEAIFTDGDNLSIKVDGEEAGEELRFRRQSRLFEFTLQDPPPPGVTVRDGVVLPADGESVADGYYVMVRSLSPGEHLIEFSGTLGPDSAFPGFSLTGTWTICVDDGTGACEQ